MMVLLDDLGYSDLGVYGGEVSTPNIDGLARDGVQLTNFHTAPLCAPTRAALMTGQDPHRVGLGSMEGVGPPGVPLTTPGYKGSLEGEFTGIAEVLGQEGYETLQVGKWHLGSGEGQTPQDLGFDQNFTLYDAGASYYPDGHRLFDRRVEPVDTAIYERNGEVVDALPEDFFATRSYTDEMIGMLDQRAGSDRPFFGYLAYTAPHDPLHVEDTDLIEHYLELYGEEYNHEGLRTERIQRMAELGLIDPDVSTRWPEQVQDWGDLSEDQRRDLRYRMAVYAANIHEADLEVGRVLDHLRATGEYDNTLIVLASDNGPAGSTQAMYTAAATDGWYDHAYPLLGDMESYGLEGSFPSLGLHNAQASSGPYFHTKNSLFEGGTRVPAIIKTPTGHGAGGDRVVDTFAHITDLYPTFAHYAGADLGTAEELLGDSAQPLLEGTSESIGPDDDHGSEHFGHRAYRSGDWKLMFVPEPMGGTGRWALYDLSADPGETTDVAADHPEIAAELASQWDRYAEVNGVVPVDFDLVNQYAPFTAAVWYAMDWADGIDHPASATFE
ncbi:sulfatase-like hydrolase/transferase [Dietzia sp. B32]|uniref:sulfatase-like hydrolase/transferase n=1 Tax=Dietzia sp. B32 TaxID=2915130 RepID=UPI0021AD76AD|nr:sulfatase-like hydrolase/transferase [Dietzia sp. B32]UVE93799.1 sulfatase-like hydrolase/transferase [Dietzia sp. B32]